MSYVGCPVGLPNRGADCFWLAVLQCLRHTPGFAAVFFAAFDASSNTVRKPSANVFEALANLLRAMQLVEAEGQLPPDSGVLDEFRFLAMSELPASVAGEKLVQYDAFMQRQQDTHEFLSQLLDSLGNIDTSNDPKVDGADRRQISADSEVLERELTEAVHAKDVARGRALQEQARQSAENLMYEYSMLQWAGSATRMKCQSLGAIFEGQHLTNMRCSACRRFGVSGAEPFIIEEVKLAAPDTDENGDWLTRLGSYFGNEPAEPMSWNLTELLGYSLDVMAREYQCLNKGCGRSGSCTRSTFFLRLPAVLVLHVNRARPDGGRCAAVLKFEERLDLRALGLVCHFGHPLDRDLEPCLPQYKLYAAVFHIGSSARSGHYFAYVMFGGYWVIIDDDRVEQPTEDTRDRKSVV